MNLIDCISARSYLFRLSDLPVAFAETLTHNAYAFNIPPNFPPIFVCRFHIACWTSNVEFIFFFFLVTAACRIVLFERPFNVLWPFRLCMSLFVLYVTAWTANRSRTFNIHPYYYINMRDDFCDFGHWLWKNIHAQWDAEELWNQQWTTWATPDNNMRWWVS